MSKTPAEIMGLNKGKLQIGYDGDLVIVDLDKAYYIDVNDFESKGKNSPFHGFKVRGKVLYTIKKGSVVYKDLRG